jgi:tetratricopeptide (TPR) repeat protein
VPESDFGYQILAEVYIADRQFQKAIDTLKKAAELNPNNIKTMITMARVHMAAQDFQKAMRITERLEKSYSEYAPVYFLQASIFEMMGKKKAAIGKHKKALELSPNHVPSLNNLAYLYTDGYGPIEKAVDMAQKAKELAPKDGRITDTLGWAFYKMGNFDDALKKFIEATYYLPGEPTIRYHLALAYLKKGMDVKAEEQLKNAIRLGRQSHFPELKDVRKWMK